MAFDPILFDKGWGEVLIRKDNLPPPSCLDDLKSDQYVVLTIRPSVEYDEPWEILDHLELPNGRELQPWDGLNLLFTSKNPEDRNIYGSLGLLLPDDPAGLMELYDKFSSRDQAGVKTPLFRTHHGPFIVCAKKFPPMQLK